MESHPVVSREAWLIARKAHLEEEKAITRARDALYRKRRELPWVKVDENYVFDGPNGRESLAELFRGRSQLFVYHFMFAPGWKEGCVGCSHVADYVDSARQHFEHRDLSFVAVSRAPYGEFAAFKARMGWKFHWVSSAGSTFNYDYGVSFTPEAVASGNVGYNYGTASYAFEDLPGASVFIKDEQGNIFHTYSTYTRGLDTMLGVYDFLDMTPLGRNEEGGGNNWLRFHDRYEPVPASAAATESCCSTEKSCCEESVAAEPMVHISRLFDAPRALVFKAWSDPQCLTRWYAPGGCTFHVAKMETRQGGSFHTCIKTPTGYECWCNGVYREFVPGERLVFTFSVADADGNTVEPVSRGMDPEWPRETIVTVTFAEEQGKTRVTLHQTVSEALAKRTGAYPSWLEMLDNLAALLPKL